MCGGWKEAIASYMSTPRIAARAKAVAAAAERKSCGRCCGAQKLWPLLRSAKAVAAAADVSVSSTSTAIVTASRWKPMTAKVPSEEGTLASTRFDKESSKLSKAFPWLVWMNILGAA
jgi:hypothetical protein